MIFLLETRLKGKRIGYLLFFYGFQHPVAAQERQQNILEAIQFWYNQKKKAWSREHTTRTTIN